MKMLQQCDDNMCVKEPLRLKSHFFNSFLMVKLQNSGPESVDKWTKSYANASIFALDMIFIPINTQNTHWTLAVIYITKKRIHYYDSCFSSSKQKTIEKYKKHLFQWLKMESETHNHQSLEEADWVWEIRNNIPQQSNGTK